MVLSSVSDYFAAMFTSDVREARQEEIKMEGVEPNSLWSLIQYAYTGNKSENKMNKNLLDLSCIIRFQISAFNKPTAVNSSAVYNYPWWYLYR